MADLQPIQNSFEAGELTELLRGRTNAERYQVGLDRCENFLPLPQGPLIKRGGWHFTSATLEDSTDDLRLFDFEVNPTLGYAVTFGPNWVEVFDENGAVLGGLAGLGLVFNPTFAQGLTGWTIATSAQASVTWDPDRIAAIMTNPRTQDDCQLGQEVTGVTNPGNTHTVYIEGGPVGDPGSTTFTLKVGTSFDADDIASVAVTTSPFTFDFTPGVADFWLTVDFDGSGTAAVDMIDCREAAGAAVPVQFVSPWPEDRFLMDREMDPTAAALYLFHPRVEPHVLAVNLATNVWSLTPIVFVNPPPAWGPGNYPRTGAFFQGRFWLGGTPNEPNTIWASKSNDFFNFDPGTALDDESIEFTFSKRGAVVWMSGAKSLLVGTESKELIITGDADGVVTPSAVDVEQQSAYGSLEAHIEEIGEKVLYVSSSGRRLRSMGYEWQRDAWVSVDLAWPSVDLTEGRLNEIAYMRDPQQLLWCSQYSGELLACMYDREMNIVGWARCPTPEFFVHRVVSDTDVGTGRSWMLCTLGDVNYVAEYDPYHLTDLHVTKADSAGFSIFDGLEHLEGYEVDVVSEHELGQAYVGRFDVFEGQVDLGKTVTQATAGLPVRSVARTLPVEGGVRVGTAQGLLKRWNKIWLRLVDSVHPKINGERPPERNPGTPMNEPQPVVTTDVEVSNLGWDREGVNVIEQDLPLRTIVAALFGEEQVNKR